MIENTTPRPKPLKVGVGESVDYSQADRNCKKCHGTGREGYVIEPTGLPVALGETAGRRIPIPCRCIRRKGEEVMVEGKLMRKLPTVKL